MVPLDLKKSFSKGDFAPVYYFYGANTLIIDKAVEDIKAAFFSGSDPGLGLESFDGQSNSSSEIINSARTLPFGASKKLVIVKSAYSFKTGQTEKFGSYFSSPSKYTCLVFVAEKMVFKGKLLTALKKAGQVVSFEKPKKEGDIKRFISESFRQRGKKISSDALNFMADNVGNDLGIIDNEVEKAVLFCGDKNIVAVTDLEAVLTTGNRDTIFDLVEAVGKGNIQKSLLLLGTLLDSDKEQHPLKILSMISRQFRLISIAKESVDKGLSRSEVGKKLGLNYDFIINKIIEQARGWSAHGLARVLEEIFETDYRLKSSRIDGKILMEELVFRLVTFRDQSYA
jgi:DNA polymerase-3 subunit delta